MSNIRTVEEILAASEQRLREAKVESARISPDKRTRAYRNAKRELDKRNRERLSRIRRHLARDNVDTSMIDNPTTCEVCLERPDTGANKVGLYYADQPTRAVAVAVVCTYCRNAASILKRDPDRARRLVGVLDRLWMMTDESEPRPEFPKEGE